MPHATTIPRPRTIDERLRVRSTAGYRWTRDDVGRYTLHDVEMCEPHVFPMPDGTDDVFSLERMRQIFQRTVNRLPRGITIVGHRSEFTEPRPQVAIVTNWRMRPSGVCVADVAEIEAPVFQQIAHGRLRNRSVEFEVDLVSGECVAIEGLALLAKRGFFPYPELRPANFTPSDRARLTQDVEDFVMPKGKDLFSFRGHRARPLANREDAAEADKTIVKPEQAAQRQDAAAAPAPTTLDDLAKMMADQRAMLDEALAGLDAALARITALEDNARAGAPTEAGAAVPVEGAEQRAMPEAEVKPGEKKPDEAERARKKIREEFRAKIDAMRVARGVCPSDEAVEETLDAVADAPTNMRERRFNRLAHGWPKAAVEPDRERPAVVVPTMPQEVVDLLESYPDGPIRERARGVYKEYMTKAAADRAERSREGRGKGQSIGLQSPVLYIKAFMGR